MPCVVARHRRRPLPFDASPPLPRPPPVLSDCIARKIETGADVYPPVELDTVVPTCGPYVMDLGGAYALHVYGGPLMRDQAVAALGRRVDVTV